MQRNAKLYCHHIKQSKFAGLKLSYLLIWTGDKQERIA